MKTAIPYHNYIENKIDSICYENKSILGHTISVNDDNYNMDITLIYNSFTVKMYYSEASTSDYSFMESENTGKALITKFEFPFLDIPYSIYDIHNTVDDKVFRTYAFHCLYNEEAVGKAIDTIIAFIDRNIDKIDSISSSEWMQKKLNDSFENGLSVASKKITPEKLKQDPEKYLERHNDNLYLLRYQETAFTNHITQNSSREIQKFYKHHLKKNTLLTYEERYLEHLFENDFNYTDEDVVNDVKKNSKVSKKIGNATSIAIFVSLVFSLAINLFIGSTIEKRLEENYILLKEVSLDSVFKILPMLFGFIMIIHRPVEYLMMKRSKDYDNTQSPYDKKINAVIALIGVVIIAGSSIYYYYDYQKNVGLGDHDIYYCQSIGKAEQLSYDNVKLYLIEGDYYGDDYSSTDDDKRIVLVKNDNYKNYFVSDYLMDMPRSYREKLDYAERFETLDHFCDKFGV